MAKKIQDNSAMFDALSRASVMGLHLISGIIVGSGLGYACDRWLETFPWCSAIGLVFGVAAGFRNLWIDAKYLIRNIDKK